MTFADQNVSFAVDTFVQLNVSVSTKTARITGSNLNYRTSVDITISIVIPKLGGFLVKVREYI